MGYVNSLNEGMSGNTFDDIVDVANTAAEGAGVVRDVSRLFNGGSSSGATNFGPGGGSQPAPDNAGDTGTAVANGLDPDDTPAKTPYDWTPVYWAGGAVLATGLVIALWPKKKKSKR